MNSLPRWFPAAVCLLPLACAGPDASAPPPGPDEVGLFPGYGGYHREVSGADAETQRWVDQGLQLVYGFNHEEGIRSFARAAEHSPDCAMAWWGIAYGNGVDVNNMEVTEEEAREGAEAARRALALADAATPAEAALIHAVAQRAVYPMPEDRTPLDEAYAAALGEAWRRFPDDPDVGTFYAESLMNLQPWDYWTAQGEPLWRAEEIVAVLEQVLAHHPMHPGANHFYIHAVEASGDAGRALAAADRLRDLVPGSGHLVHMPSHIYINTGRYDQAVRANQAAIAADERYFAAAGEPGFYSLYFLHNIHFLAYAAMMEGRAQVALDAVRRMEREVPEQFLTDYLGFADGLMPAVFHVLVRFGRWEDILAEPDYPAPRLASRTIRRYARAVALANLRRTDEARAELAAYDELAAQVPGDWLVGTNKAGVVNALARQVAEGEILFKEGRHEEAFEVLRAARDAEDELVYDEPPGWMLPVRHAYGALLLAGGHPAEAEQTYREDLARWPENAWSLLGLGQSLRALGRGAEADALEPRLRRAWARADVDPPASCYCGVR